MEKVDWALLISILSLFAAVAGAFYTRRMAIQGERTLQRPQPMLEVIDSRPLGGFIDGKTVAIQGYWTVHVSIRNLDPNARLKVTRIFACSGFLIAPYEAITVADDNQILAPRILQAIPDEMFTNIIDVDVTLAPSGSARNQTSQGDAVQLIFVSKRAMKARNFRFDWEWLDGQPK